MSICLGVRPSVHKKFSILVKFGMYVDIDGMQYDPIQDQGQDHEPCKFKVGLLEILSQTLSPPPCTMGAGN